MSEAVTLNTGGVLSYREIEARMKSPPSDPQHLHVVPAAADSLQAAAVEVRLGNWFSVAKKGRIPVVELTRDLSRPFLSHDQREDVFIPTNKAFLLHPGDLVLGITFEYIGLPGDLVAAVEGRSSTGRMGLAVATASQIGPGFHGCVVLELVNTGTVPLKLYPLTAVAQLVLYQLKEPVHPTLLYSGKYDRQIRP